MLHLDTFSFGFLAVLVFLAALLWLAHWHRPFSRDRRVIIYSSRLSPFCLKLEACLVAGSIEYCDSNSLPTLHAALIFLRVVLAKLAHEWSFLLAFGVGLENEPGPLGDLPLLPYLIASDMRGVWYDSTFLCRRALLSGGASFQHGEKWVPQTEASESGAYGMLDFLEDFVDEFCDEFGLYLVHHRRWTAVHNNQTCGQTPGDFLASESPARNLPGLVRNTLAGWFNARQTRRLPYLFSVAPPDSAPQAPHMPAPPCPVGFPPTWTLLDNAYLDLLRATENIFTSRDLLFASRGWTVADASLFGQLNMLARLDAGSRAEMSRMAPATLAWLDRIEASINGSAPFPFAARGHSGSSERMQPSGSKRRLSRNCNASDDESFDVECLRPLLALADTTFVPLMKQNLAAFELLPTGAAMNEVAFDARQALYDGELRGHRFRHVVKSFQVVSWRSLMARFGRLSGADQHSILQLVPSLSSS